MQIRNQPVTNTTPLSPREQSARPSDSSTASSSSSSSSMSVDEKEVLLAENQTNPLEAFEQATDEMSAALTQFRNRRDYERKSGALSENFDRVLEEDVYPKAEKIVAIARLKQIPLEELLRNARRLFPDDSDLMMVLRELVRRKGLDEITKKRLSELMRQVAQQADPKRLKAGIHCSLKAKLFSKKLQVSAMLLRETYRQFLESEDSGAATYEDWITLYGCDKRALVLTFVEAALVTDMGALDPSCSRLEFGSLLNRIGVLKVLRSADIVFIQQMLSNALVTQINNRETDWLVFLLSILQYPMALSDSLLEVFGAEVVFHSYATRSGLIQVLQRTIAALPLTLFPSQEERDAMLDELLRMADITYEQEQRARRRRRR